MAESIVLDVVSGVLSDAASKLASLAIQEAAFLRGVGKQVQQVEEELKRMQVFLKVAMSKKRGGDERVEHWIREIRDVAYEVEDIIDTVKFMAERQRQRRGFMGSLSRYTHKPLELHKIGTKIEEIEEKIRRIFESRGRYGIPNLGENGVDQSRSDWDNHLQALRDIPDHFFDDSDVIGFKDDREKLVKLLVDPGNKNRSVISIVGMGGLGKTTLARKVYNMVEVKNHFDTSIWLTISQKYDVKAILKDIVKNNISSVTKEELEEMNEEKLTEELHKFFKDKKYFVVMDDVWEVLAWERIHQAFPNTNNGSRVLLTTRKIEVAKSIDPSIDPYELHFLKEAESWELFRRKAFGDQDIPEELQGVGRNLAKKCGGLPLALIVLGGFMANKERNYPAWSDVDKSFEWEDVDAGKRCPDILGLSYNDLPHQLKSCFLYIAAFPEDSIISASKLVRLWTAEGFIPQRPKRTLEETARNDCLDVLVQRCMLQVAERSMAHGWVKSIRIHDMLRDFGQSEARKVGFLQVCSSDHDMAVAHRAAFHNLTMNDQVADFSHLRTLLGFNLVLKGSTAAGRFLNGLNSLRVLDLEGAIYLGELPKEMGNMIHVRYLGLRSCTGLTRLPSSIGQLLNLQTLDLRGTFNIWLPKSFWKIRTLRHLYINFDLYLSAPLSGDHKNLQTLHIEFDRLGKVIRNALDFIEHPGISFIKNWVTTPGFAKEAAANIYDRMVKKSFKKVLATMDSLFTLTLWIFPPSNYEICGDVLFALAPKLQCLRSLTLRGPLLLEQHKQLPDSSQFPPNLTKLKLEFSGLNQDPMPVLEKLPNLRLLELHEGAYMETSMSCSTGGFPRLQHLILQGLGNLEEWRVEVGAMPSLTQLTISDCRKLKMLPEGLQHVTTLRELKLIDMLDEFNDGVRNEVGHIPSIIFEKRFIR